MWGWVLFVRQSVVKNDGAEGELHHEDGAFSDSNLV